MASAFLREIVARGEGRPAADDARIGDATALPRRIAEVVQWQAAKDVRALVRVLGSPTEHGDARARASEALWQLWESKAVNRHGIEVAVGPVSRATEEAQALTERVKAALEAEWEVSNAWRRALHRFSLPSAGDTAKPLLAHPLLPILASGSSSWDCKVRVWDLESRCCLRVLEGHEGAVQGLAFDPAGRRLASASHDSTVRLWDLDSGTCLHTLAGHSDFVRSVVWNATGALVASGSNDETIRVWDASTGASQCTLEGHAGWVLALASHPTDDLFASGSDDVTVRVWRWSSGECVRALAGHTRWVTSLAASASFLLSGSEDQSVRVWSWTSGACVRLLDAFDPPLVGVSALAWRDATLASVKVDGTVRVWDTAPPDPAHWSWVGALPLRSAPASGLAVVEGGRVVCSVSGDETTIAVWGM